MGQNFQGEKKMLNDHYVRVRFLLHLHLLLLLIVSAAMVLSLALNLLCRLVFFFGLLTSLPDLLYLSLISC